MLEVIHCSKAFGKQTVLKDVSLSVERGQVVSIIGPSGSGKTTLLRCINFLERADSGTMNLDGVSYDMHHVHGHAAVAFRQRTGFVFQNYNLFANKNALMNVAYGLRVARKIPKREAMEMAERALARVGLSDKLTSMPHELSGGQQQRVGIARAIAASPEIVLLDEPTSALDPELVGEVLSVIRSLAADGMTMLVVTHEMNFARNISNHVVFMDGGAVVEEGAPDALFGKPSQERTAKFLASLANK